MSVKPHQKKAVPREELGASIRALKKEGLTYPEIAERLGIGRGTVYYHLRGQEKRERKAGT